jgi:hypothetical protein
MSEVSIVMMRNEPRSKLELVYNDNGWTKEGGKPEAAAYILRLWITRDGNAIVREIKMRPKEYLLLVEEWVTRQHLVKAANHGE